MPSEVVPIMSSAIAKLLRVMKSFGSSARAFARISLADSRYPPLILSRANLFAVIGVAAASWAFE